LTFYVIMYSFIKYDEHSVYFSDNNLYRESFRIKKVSGKYRTGWLCSYTLIVWIWEHISVTKQGGGIAELIACPPTVQEIGGSNPSLSNAEKMNFAVIQGSQQCIQVFHLSINCMVETDEQRKTL
jgi:hypothetical protein